jgi:hypothetical protein
LGRNANAELIFSEVAAGTTAARTSPAETPKSAAAIASVAAIAAKSTSPAAVTAASASAKQVEEQEKQQADVAGPDECSKNDHDDDTAYDQRNRAHL